MHPSLKNLNVLDGQSITDLLMAVQAGEVSSRRAAKEICAKLPKKHLSADEKLIVFNRRAAGHKIQDIASDFNIDASTVWRICEKIKKELEND